MEKVMTSNASVSLAPVHKTVTVRASLEHTFEVFTEGFDTWWPRSHHIGQSPMKKAIIEGHAGGRCYSEQADGTDCDWGRVLVWEPPHRFLMAWQVNGQWQFEPDLAKCSEVEVRFTDAGNGATRVDLEHRYFERHGAGAENMRMAVDSQNGWSGTLGLFQARVEQ
jgi:uncharacterized protein YndB with AHSA1/START domain